MFFEMSETFHSVTYHNNQKTLNFSSISVV